MRIGIIVALSLALTAADALADWPGFRGPGASDLQAASLPLTWSPTEHILWSVDVAGTGQSSPVVWKDHVYITSVEGPEKDICHVLAVDLKTGEKLWQGSTPNATPTENSNYVSKAAPTAVTDDRGVVALFEGGNLLALKHDGTQRWEKNLVEEYGPIRARHGLASSLLQSPEMLIVWIEREEDPYILALHPETGKTLWKVPGLGKTSWSSPVRLTVGGTEQLVFSGTGMVRGIDPATGAVLWTFEDISGNATPSPTAVGDGLLLVGATDGRGESGGGKASDSNGLIRVTQADDGTWDAEFVWRAKRATSSFGSPIAHQGLAYFVNRTGVLFCLDLMTGEEVYAKRTPESCWATPLGVGDRIYLVGKSGTTTVIHAGREFEVLTENRLWDSDGETPPPALGGGPIQYAVAAVPGKILIRTGEQVFCLGEDVSADN